MANVINRTTGNIVQADSPVTIDLPDDIKELQLGISRSATPTAGVLSVRGKMKGALNFGDILGTIDLTTPTMNPYLFDGAYATLEFTLVNLDADKNIIVNIAGW